MVLNKRIKIYGADITDTAPALTYCDHARKVVSIKDANYIDNLLNICKGDGIDLIIPTIDTDLLILSENKDEFTKIGTKVMISEPDKIRICRDKNNISQFFVDCGLHAPTPYHEWHDYDGGFPAFIKPKDGSSSINAFRADNFDELEVYAEQIQDYVIQPFISGREYTIDIFCDWEGNPISIVPRERMQVRAGEVLKTRITMDHTMEEEAFWLCDSFRPCGPMTVQLIQDNKGVNWYIEINPRFGGGAPLSMKAGARSAEAILKLLDDENVDYCREIADGAVYSRFDQSICIEEGAGIIKGFIFDLDDTLYSEKQYVRSGFKSVSDYLGSSIENTLWDFFAEGKPAIDEVLKMINRDDEKALVMKLYHNHKPDIELYNGVGELIDTLLREGKKVGIITDGRPEGQRNKLEALGLYEKIGGDNIIITDELGGVQFRKPCDLAFRLLQTRWKLDPSQIVYVGDNLNKDFQAPRQLGMKSLWLNNPDGLYTKGVVGCSEKAIGVKEIGDIREVTSLF